MDLITILVAVCSIFTGGCFETDQKVLDAGERLHGHAPAYVCTSVRERTRTVHVTEKEGDISVEYEVRLDPGAKPVLVSLQHVASDRYIAVIRRQTMIMGNDRYVHVLARIRDRIIETFSVSNAQEKQIAQDLGVQSFKTIVKSGDKRTFLERLVQQEPASILATCVPTT